MAQMIELFGPPQFQANSKIVVKSILIMDHIQIRGSLGFSTNWNKWINLDV